MLTDTQKERYKRNIALPEIGESGQITLLAAKVLICGAGGLGSGTIANLASLGVGNIGIIDKDKLELSNFNRQFIHKFKNLNEDKTASAKEWIEEFNPDIKVKTYNINFAEENIDILLDYDLVLDCFDSYKSKFLLNKACIEVQKPLIHAGASGFQGQVLTIVPNKSACLECLFPENNDSYVEKGVISPVVSVISSIQALEAVKFLTGQKNLLINRLLSYDCMEHSFKILNIEQNPACKLCGTK